MLIQLYSKRRCPLCEDAREILGRLQAEFGFTLEERFIEDSPDLFARFRYDVPVAFVDGERAFTHRTSEAELRSRLKEIGTSVAHLRRDDA